MRGGTPAGGAGAESSHPSLNTLTTETSVVSAARSEGASELNSSDGLSSAGAPEPTTVHVRNILCELASSPAPGAESGKEKAPQGGKASSIV